MIDALIWVILIPLLGGLVAVLFPRIAGITGILSTAGMVFACLVLIKLVADSGPQVYLVGGWSAGLGISLYADGLSSLFLLMTAMIALAVSIYASSYFRQSHLRLHYWPLWLLLLSALSALLLASDLFNIYVTLELLGISAVALTALDGKRPAVEAAVRYLVLGLLGSLGFLAGVALLYAAYGSLDLATLATRIQPGAASWAAAALMTAGLMIKTALFPMHFWLPPAHANAPAPVSAALSALVVKAAFYLVLRLWLDLFGVSLSGGVSTLIGLLGAAAVLWGSWCALQAERLKVLAAYSTVAQIGYLFIFLALILEMPVGIPRDEAIAGLMLMALSHGFAKSAFFLSTGIIQQRQGHDRIKELAGAVQGMPVTTFTLALAGIALIGLPISGAFLGKWQLIDGALYLHDWLLALVVLAGSLLASAYIFRVLGQAFGNSPYPTKVLSIGMQEIPAMVLALIATLVLGLASGPIWPFLEVTVMSGRAGM